MTKKLQPECMISKIEAVGYKVISFEGESYETIFEICCDKKHITKMKWVGFIQGHRCKECHIENSRNNPNDIEKQINSFGYKLITPKEEYKRSSQLLEMSCPKLHNFKMRWDDFRGGVRCPYCAGLNQKTTQEVSDIFCKEGYTLLTKDYKNNKQILEIECPEKHLWKANLHNFLNGARCLYCFGHPRKTPEQVRAQFAAEGYEWVDGYYKNCSSKLGVLCPDKHYYITCQDYFKQNYRCPICSSGCEERFVKMVVEFLFGVEFNKIRPCWLKNENGNNLELDMFNEELLLAVEYNGVQHYEVPAFMTGYTQENLEKTQHHDRIKVKRCDEVGINFIVIPQLYKQVKPRDLKQYIKDQLIEKCIPIPKGFDKKKISVEKFKAESRKKPSYK